MRATELRAVDLLQAADVLQLSTDPRFYRVVGIDAPAARQDTRYGVFLKSLCGTSNVNLCRAGHELVLVVPRLDAPGALERSGEAANQRA